jgi:tetratricopeptide (TPR) repeat protein
VGALSDYRKATDLEPQQATYWNLLCSAFSALKSHGEALEPYTKAIELTEDTEVKAMCLRNRAEAFIELEKLEEAEEDLERARGLDTEHPYLFARYGQLHL